ncbi:MAG: rod shape-determining protein MreD [Candidatus Aminicenantes bacterium]|jgi:rod shape-determining protein MreD|nr:rod shape-determining protein MreD [Candidatus Aminicenantes bacterium]
MKDILNTAAATLAAFILYSLLGRIDPPLLLVLNAFSLVVIFFSMLKGELFGVVLGALCGLLQDSFSMGVFGVAGLSKTLLGFMAGYVSRKMNVIPFFRNFIFIFVLAAGELAVWAFLYALVFSERMITGNALFFFQPLATAVLGSSIFALARRLKAPQT